MSEYEVSLQAEKLGVWESQYIDCPFCGRKGRFSLTRKDDGVVYHCFSTNCGAAGFIPDHRGAASAPPRPQRNRRYIGDQLQPSNDDVKFFYERFGIEVQRRGDLPNSGWSIGVTIRGEYIFPIHDSDGLRVGEVIRQPTWEGCPRQPVPGKPKALTYLDDKYLRWSWHQERRTMVVLVEDQISAEKIRQCAGYASVALLGHTVNNLQAYHSALRDASVVAIWLDKDVAPKAYEMNAKYGGLWRSSRVIVTDKDPKDLADEEIREVLFD